MIPFGLLKFALFIVDAIFIIANQHATPFRSPERRKCALYRFNASFSSLLSSLALIRRLLINLCKVMYRECGIGSQGVTFALHTFASSSDPPAYPDTN